MDDFVQALAIGDDLGIDMPIDGEIKTLKSEVIAIVNGTKLIISCPSYQGRLVTLAPGERYRIFHADSETGLYEFNGLIVHREKSDQQVLLHILRVSHVSRAQRRNFFRLSLVETGYLNIPDGEGEEVFIHQGERIVQVVPKFRRLEVMLKDISAGGARIYSKEQFEIGTILTFCVLLEQENYALQCEIVRSFLVEDVVKRYDLGIKFINMDSQLQSKLVGVIFDKQRKLLKKGLSS